MAFGFPSIDDLTPPPSDEPQPVVAPFDDQTEADKLEQKMSDIRLAETEAQTKNQAAVLGLSYIQLDAMPIGPEVIGLIPEETARAAQALVFLRVENQIRVAVVNPDNPGVHDIVARLQREHPGSDIALYVVSPHSFDQAARLYRSVATVKQVEYGIHITKADLDRYQQEIDSHDTLNQRLQGSNMTENFAVLIAAALKENSSDIHIESAEHGLVVRFRVDGLLTNVAQLPLTARDRFVNRIKVIANIKINVKDRPQDGSVSIELDNGEKIDIRVSTLPSAFGESVVMRLLRSGSINVSFGDLGIRPTLFARLKTEIEKPNGMILTTGPTGSGKTTTLYAILKHVNTGDNKIITLENPIEYKLEGIVQSQVESGHHYDFATGLKSILRQDPDIVMVGEIRDLETAQTAVEASLTGHVLLSTLHTNDAAGVIPRLLGLGIKGVYLAPSINAVIGQRLVRRVCTNCKQPYTPSGEELQKARDWAAAIPKASGEAPPNVDQVQFVKGAGCATCGNSGYKGRIGIYEIFTMLPEIEQHLLAGTMSEFEMRQLLHDAGMITMGQDGILKAIEGITTLEEVFRVAKQ